MIGLQGHRILDLQYRHFGARGQNAGHLAAHIRIEMHDHDEGRAHLFGQRTEKMLQCTDAAGRGADTDHDGFWMDGFPSSFRSSSLGSAIAQLTFLSVV
jgi:hypothetical protein